MFGINTGEEIPKSYLTEHDAWDRFVGCLWCDLLCLLDFDSSATVVEIGPGTSLKIGYALARLGFQGEFYLVDASKKVLDILKPKYEALLPQAKIICVSSPAENCRDRLPKQMDFLLASHIIDDMILYHERSDEVLSWAESYTHAPADILKKTWAELEHDAARLILAKGAAANTLFDFVRNLDLRGVILNQYPSSTFYDHGMGSLNDHAYDVLETLKIRNTDIIIDAARVQEILNVHKNYGNPHIGEHVLNAKYWMMLCP